MFVMVCWTYGKWCLLIFRSTVPLIDHSMVKVCILTVLDKTTPSFVDMFSGLKSWLVFCNLPYIYIYIYIYICGDSKGRAFHILPKELFSQIYLFWSYKYFLWTSQSFPSARLVVLLRLENTVCPYYLTLSRGWEKRRIHAFPESINIKWNANCLDKDLNMGHQFHFLQW